MQCTKCKKGQLTATHTYDCGVEGSVQRAKCEKCGCVAVTHRMVIRENPPRGKGAAWVASEARRRLAAQSKSPAQTGYSPATAAESGQA